tara:strand:+ start:2049 stop:2195 length:147 start_codon:yes stop_codon:yes gene_type:complete
MEILILFALVCAVLGYAVATEENKVMGVVLGLILGPIGIIIAAIMKTE